MAVHVDPSHPLEGAFSALLNQGLDGAGEALRILINEACKIERAQHLGANPYERTSERLGYANGFKPKTMTTRLGEITVEVPQVRDSSFYPSALEKGSRTERAVNLALAEMYVQGVGHHGVAETGGTAGGDLLDAGQPGRPEPRRGARRLAPAPFGANPLRVSRCPL